MIHKFVPEMGRRRILDQCLPHDRQNTLILDPLAHFLAVVGFVGGNSERRPATRDGNAR